MSWGEFILELLTRKYSVQLTPAAPHIYGIVTDELGGHVGGFTWDEKTRRLIGASNGCLEIARDVYGPLWTPEIVL